MMNEDIKEKFEIENGTLLSYTGEEENVIIPNGVITIGKTAFSACAKIKSVVIPEGVININEDAFYSCKNLMRVYIPSTVKKIHKNAFFGCNRLVEVYDLSSIDITKVRRISDALVMHFSLEEETNIVLNEEGFLFIQTEDGNYLFNYIGDLTKIVLPSSFKGESYHVNEFAFYENKNIISVTIPSAVISIGEDAFSHCKKLVEIYNLSQMNIEKGSRLNGEVGYRAKAIHKSLDEESFIISKDGYSFIFDGNEYYLFDYQKGMKEHFLPSDINGCRYNILKDTFSFDYEIKFVNLSNGVKIVGNKAFYCCLKLEQLIISKDVEKIEKDAFAYCYKLVEIYNLSKNISEYNKIGFDAVIIHDSMVDSNITKQEGYCFVNNGLDYYLFGYEGDESNLNLPSNVLGHNYEIYKMAFIENMNITSVLIPDGVTSIRKKAFYYCDNLEKVEFSESIINIDIGAFSLCNKLEKIMIPKNVRYIGEYAFSCENIKSIIVDKDNKVYDSRNYCNAIIESSTNKLIAGCINTIIPSDIITIGECAFQNSNIEEIILPQSVTSIEDSAFSCCERITSITIPPNITTINEFCFAWCSSLIEIKLPKTIKEIHFGALSDCDLLINVYFEGSKDEWKKVYMDNWNEILNETNMFFYSYTSLEYEFQNLGKRDKIKYKINIEDIPNTYVESLLEKDIYIFIATITHISVVPFPKQNCIFIRMAVKKDNYLVHVRYFIEFKEEDENIDFNFGDEVFIRGTLCYDDRYEMVVVSARDVKRL